ncbi:MAG: hypothetical protein JWQ39_730 [Glaciihabitans sp.]|nr:hypothetical protein [Glaciihabitans sp.]
MVSTNKSYQQLDPVGGYSTRPITLVYCLAIAVYAGVQSYIGRDAVEVPVLEWAALAAILLAMAGVAFWSSSLRAPFPLGGFIVIMVLSMSGMILDAAATWRGPSIPPGEWGPTVVGFTILQLAPYRPTRDIVISTVLGALEAGFIAVLHPASNLPGEPWLVNIVTSTLPLIAFGFGGAAHAASLGKALGRMRSASELASRAASLELRDRVVAAVMHDRVSILNHTVVPFFTDVLLSNRVTQDVREGAREISSSIRSIMVAEADRSWLDTVVDQIGGAQDGSLPGSEVVQDDDRLAVGMNTEQRIVIRALLVALFEHPGFDADGFGIMLERHGTRCHVLLTAKLDHDESIPRSGLAAYLAVLRIVFGDLLVTFQSPTLTLRFSYEHK